MKAGSLLVIFLCITTMMGCKRSQSNQNRPLDTTVTDENPTDAAQGEGDISKLEQRLEAALEANEAMKAKVDSLQNDLLSDEKDLEESLGKLKEELAESQKEIDEKSDAIDKIEDENKILQANIDNLKNELEEPKEDSSSNDAEPNGCTIGDKKYDAGARISYNGEIFRCFSPNFRFVGKEGENCSANEETFTPGEIALLNGDTLLICLAGNFYSVE
ncbi:hypothetical protein [Pseudobacteriovorax antillogorgiicola]|uniref:Uncharacterized protein n=1 Tax=Pseudobacteriovorax antillogorgiicola TaxID=1513793 RepID=A0A1Y6BAE8_9BACT|nr:hypothetical protein [Pseudobacteriovorax antillogorgiicola]TCS58549.1 hypothetical protein EDD56_10262 [Pseudobacteriovorax antillogorgiicola]SME97729.1 hypothetical protein SAMN06296036_102381 [Pseudobacteriovorax antillogorgiicola]